MKEKCRREYNCDDIPLWGILCFLPLLGFYTYEVTVSVRNLLGVKREGEKSSAV